MAEIDPQLRRIEHGSVVACAAMALVAWAVARDWAAAAGVVAGGALVAVSYCGIKGGIDALVRADTGPAARKRAAIGLVKFFTRYGILAAVAYVTMARVRLPAVAVVAGASSIVVAIAVEAARQVWRPNRPGTD